MESENLIPPSIFKNLPVMAKDSLAKLSIQRQEEFLDEYSRKMKHSGNAYVCWLLLGWHYAYLRKWGLQVLFLLTGGGFLIWWFIDLFQIPNLVRDYNKDLAINILRDIKIINS